MKIAVPTEHHEQATLMRWSILAQAEFPELGMLFAVPNGGDRHPATAARLKAEGVRAGVPDLCLPVARGKFHGLFIEMKRRRGGVVSAEQCAWMAALERQGYATRVCLGWEQARETLSRYLTNGTLP